MNSQNYFQFPVLTIRRVRPLLEKGGVVFAHEIEAETQNGFVVSFYENKGLDLKNFIGKSMYCLLEITQGRLAYKEDYIEGDCLVMEYQWQRRLFQFFPELLEIRERLSEIDISEELTVEEKFESEASVIYKEWGLNGLDIGIYQLKPFFLSAIGHFLLNEYEFEEDIDVLELNDKVYIDIEEMFLRGIGPVLSKKEIEIKQQQDIYQVFQGKEYTKEEWRKFMMDLSNK